MTDEKKGRMPVVASFADMGKNLGSAYGMGFDVVNNLSKNNHTISPIKTPTNFKSVGGMMTLGGLAPIGAAAGGIIGMYGDKYNLVGNMIGGAALGAAALPLAGAAGGLAYNAGKSLLTSTLSDGSMLRSAAKATPSVAAGIGKGVAGLINGTNTSGLLGTAMSPVRRAANTVGKIANNMVKVSEGAESISDLSLTGTGMMLFAGSEILDGVKRAGKKFEESRMGRSDGQITRATPRVSSYLDDAGATGDLVFAMNKNRRG